MSFSSSLSPLTTIVCEKPGHSIVRCHFSGEAQYSSLFPWYGEGGFVVSTISGAGETACCLEASVGNSERRVLPFRSTRFRCPALGWELPAQMRESREPAASPVLENQLSSRIIHLGGDERANRKLSPPNGTCRRGSASYSMCYDLWVLRACGMGLEGDIFGTILGSISFLGLRCGIRGCSSAGTPVNVARAGA